MHACMHGIIHACMYACNFNKRTQKNHLARDSNQGESFGAIKTLSTPPPHGIMHACMYACKFNKRTQQNHLARDSNQGESLGAIKNLSTPRESLWAPRSLLRVLPGDWTAQAVSTLGATHVTKWPMAHKNRTWPVHGLCPSSSVARRLRLAHAAPWANSTALPNKPSSRSLGCVV